MYAGAGTTPPAAWVCNDDYWDAGDGCDCNCGALDPDCGGAGQQLHGCTGLDQPTCDTQGLCTGGGACHAVPGSAYLTHYMVIGTAPTTFGGTVRTGRYEATAEFGMAGAWQMALEWDGPAGRGSVTFEGAVQ